MQTGGLVGRSQVGQEEDGFGREGSTMSCEEDLVGGEVLKEVQ